MRVREGVGAMTPAEVLAMRDRLAEEMWEAKLGVCYDDCVSVADWLLTSRLTREKIAEVIHRSVYKTLDIEDLTDENYLELFDQADAVLALLVGDTQR